LHIDSSWDGRYLSYTNSDEFVSLYDTTTNELHISSYKGQAVWHPNGKTIFIVKDNKIDVFSFEDNTMSLYHEGKLVAPDPRRTPVLDIVEINDDIFANMFSNQNLVPIMEAGSLYHWDESLPHTDPEWWRYYTERVNTDTSSVTSGIDTFATSSQVLDSASLSTNQTNSGQSQVNEAMLNSEPLNKKGSESNLFDTASAGVKSLLGIEGDINAKTIILGFLVLATILKLIVGDGNIPKV
jgi:hypothetical protein